MNTPVLAVDDAAFVPHAGSCECAECVAEFDAFMKVLNAAFSPSPELQAVLVSREALTLQAGVFLGVW